MEYVCIGKVVKTHGLKGELKIYSYSDFDSQRYKKGNTVYLKDSTANDYLSFVVASFRKQKEMSIVSFENYRDINLVESFKGYYVYVEKASREPLSKGHYYRDDIIGLEVMDQNGNAIGKVISIEETIGAQNNMRIERIDGNCFLYPFVEALIHEVNLEKNLIQIELLEGL